jgi:TonB family protein
MLRTVRVPETPACSASTLVRRLALRLCPFRVGPVFAASTAVAAALVSAALTAVTVSVGMVAAVTTAAAQDASPRPPQAPPPSLVPPRLESAPEVALPDDAEPLPERASVALQLDIGADGAVREVVVLAGVREDVDALVVDAARRMRFSPATRDGVPIPARVRFAFAVRSPQRVPTAPGLVAGGGGGAGGAVDHAGAADAAADAATDEEGVGGPPGATRAGDDPSGAGEAPGSAATEQAPFEPPPTFGARAVAVPPEPAAATRVVLTGAELSTVPGTFGEPLRVVASLPGVARSPFGLGYFVVRGAAFENTGFFVDGFPVPILYHLGAGPAVISSRLVERLDFYPGGYPVNYGRFNAGIIALRTAPPSIDRFAFEAEVDAFRASALAIAPLPERRGKLAVAFRRSYYELVLPLLIDGIDLSFTDWQVRLDYKFSRRVRASLFVFGSSDTLDTTQAVGQGETASAATTGVEYGFTRVIARLEWRPVDELRLSASGTVGRDANVARRREPGAPDLGIDVGALFLGERLDATWQPTRALETRVGLDLAAFVIGAEADLPIPPGFGEFPQPEFDPQTFSLDTRIVSLGVGAYADQRVELGPLQIVGGLRVDQYRYGEVSTALVQPRAVARYTVVDGVVVKAATGLFSQTPQPFQLIPNLGSSSLAPNRSWQSSGGLELKLPLDVEVETQVFYTAMYGLARPANELVDDGRGGARRQFFFDDGEGRAYGWELLVRRKVAEGFYGWLSYTLSRSERFVEGGQVVPFNFDQTHVLNLAASYKIWRLRFGVRFQLATGRPSQSVVGAIYDADGDRYRPVRAGFDERLPAFHQLDARVDYEFPLGPFEASVYVDALNVYNAQNSEGWQYQYDFTRRFRLPALPALATLGFKLVY